MELFKLFFVLALAFLLAFLVFKLTRNKKSHLKYPPTDTLGGWD